MTTRQPCGFHGSVRRKTALPNAYAVEAEEGEDEEAAEEEKLEEGKERREPNDACVGSITAGNPH